VAVQQLQGALEARRPKVEILSPADGALLPEGPWTLQLRAEDWPLVDAGPLGLGPHLVVQLDGDPPLPLTTTTTTMRPLEPGSHRLTAYAARPWGEVVKSPGAQRQIRLHRVAANPLGLPAAGSPQLIPVSPRGQAATTPLLLDWLLLDAPLQNLRAMDVGWRLRVSVNGDSFLVDQQTPLWLEGWRNGSNAIQLELLDGIGDPLNPPFNSLVGEVRLEPGGPRPRWQGGRLEPAELAALLGEAPPPSEPEPPRETPPEPSPQAAPEPAPGTESSAAHSAEPAAEPLPESVPPSEPAPEPAPEPSEQEDHETPLEAEPESGVMPEERSGTEVGSETGTAAGTEAPAPPTMAPEPDRPSRTGNAPAESAGAARPEPAFPGPTRPEAVPPNQHSPEPALPEVSDELPATPSEPASVAADPNPAPRGRPPRLPRWLTRWLTP
jgi:hypothetical protein